MCGALVEPCLALPVPFCLKGFLPPPLTSALVFVEADPCLASANSATKTSCITCLFGSIPNMSLFTSIVPACEPSNLYIFKTGMLSSSLSY